MGIYDLNYVPVQVGGLSGGSGYNPNTNPFDILAGTIKKYNQEASDDAVAAAAKQILTSSNAGALTNTLGSQEYMDTLNKVKDAKALATLNAMASQRALTFGSLDKSREDAFNYNVKATMGAMANRGIFNKVDKDGNPIPIADQLQKGIGLGDGTFGVPQSILGVAGLDYADRIQKNQKNDADLKGANLDNDAKAMANFREAQSIENSKYYKIYSEFEKALYNDIKFTAGSAEYRAQALAAIKAQADEAYKAKYGKEPPELLIDSLTTNQLGNFRNIHTNPLSDRWNQELTAGYAKGGLKFLKMFLPDRSAQELANIAALIEEGHFGPYKQPVNAGTNAAIAKLVATGSPQGTTENGNANTAFEDAYKTSEVAKETLWGHSNSEFQQAAQDPKLKDYITALTTSTGFDINNPSDTQLDEMSTILSLPFGNKIDRRLFMRQVLKQESLQKQFNNINTALSANKGAANDSIRQFGASIKDSNLNASSTSDTNRAYPNNPLANIGVAMPLTVDSYNKFGAAVNHINRLSNKNDRVSAIEGLLKYSVEAGIVKQDDLNKLSNIEDKYALAQQAAYALRPDGRIAQINKVTSNFASMFDTQQAKDGNIVIDFKYRDPATGAIKNKSYNKTQFINMLNDKHAYAEYRRILASEGATYNVITPGVNKAFKMGTSFLGSSVAELNDWRNNRDMTQEERDRQEQAAKEFLQVTKSADKHTINLINDDGSINQPKLTMLISQANSVADILTKRIDAVADKGKTNPLAAEATMGKEAGKLGGNAEKAYNDFQLLSLSPYERLYLDTLTDDHIKGLAIKYKDPDKMRKALKQAANNPIFLEKMRKNLQNLTGQLERYRYMSGSGISSFDIDMNYDAIANVLSLVDSLDLKQ